eukprot:2328820-Rhodomonas_salina.1
MPGTDIASACVTNTVAPLWTLLSVYLPVSPCISLYLPVSLYTTVCPRFAMSSTDLARGCLYAPRFAKGALHGTGCYATPGTDAAYGATEAGW